MPSNALTNPLILPILGLLTEGSRHGYGLYKDLRDRYVNLTVRRSTVYTLLESLIQAGWVDIRDDEPGPAPFAITEAGSASLADGVARQLVDAPLGPSEPFQTAIAYLGILTPRRASDLLTQRLEKTRQQLARDEHILNSHPIRELHMLETHYMDSVLRHDAQWLARTTHRIETGDLSWPTS